MQISALYRGTWVNSNKGITQRDLNFGSFLRRRGNGQDQNEQSKPRNFSHLFFRLLTRTFARNCSPPRRVTWDGALPHSERALDGDEET